MPQPALSVDQLFALMARHGVTGDLARVMVAAALAESDGVPDLVGDNGHSVGLYQMHDQGKGAGLTVAQRADPDFATEAMRPDFAAAFAQGGTKGLNGEERATFAYMHAELPAGFPSLDCPAANRFRGKVRSLDGTEAPAPVGGRITVGATVAVSTRDGLRLRGNPGLAGAVLRTMPGDTVGQVIDGPRSADGFRWWKLRVDGVEGWAADAFLVLRAAAASAAVTTGGRVGTDVEVTAEDGLRLRGGPGLNNPVVMLMPLGTHGRVIAGPETADGFDWLKLRVGDILGWAASEFLLRSAPPEADTPLDPRVLELRQWIPIDAPVKNAAGARLADTYNTAIDQFGVEVNPRYAPHDGLTFCNIFVSDVTRAMKAEIPHRVNPNTFAPDDNGQEQTCGGMIAWLNRVGGDFGWRRVADGAAAQAAANVGQPAIVITPPGVTHEEEHTAIIRPAPLDPQLGPMMAQAGARNRRAIRFGQIFGNRDVTFWVHD